MALETVFAMTGGMDPDALPDPSAVEPSPSFVNAFRTPGPSPSGGPMGNVFDVVMPDRSDRYYDNSSFHDFRLQNGLGVGRAFRKPDSMPGSVPGGFYGPPVPNKQFGRSTRSHDQIWNREKNIERAMKLISVMGSKPNEVPEGTDLKPYDWNNQQALGVGGPGDNVHNYNRHYGVPDADAVARRLYEPTPSRRTQMITTDIEIASTRPQRATLHPTEVVAADLQRSKEQRTGKNTDVRESVIYENIMPRGMAPPNGQEAPMVYKDVGVLRQAVGTNETGDRTVLGRWQNPGEAVGRVMHAATNQDKTQLYYDHAKYVRGLDLENEVAIFRRNEAYLNRRMVPDPSQVRPHASEYPHNQSGPSRPLVPYPSAGIAM